MDKAFDRLTQIQKHYINKHMFEQAYIIMSTFNINNDSDLFKVCINNTINCPHLTSDLIRYCKLAHSVM